MLENLQADLLEPPLEVCLPRNLSDEWLDWLALSADYMLEDGHDESVNGTAIIAVVLRLVHARIPTDAEPVEVSYEELHKYTHLYRAELAFEAVHRNSEITYNPATLDTILTEREILSWNKNNPLDDE